MPYTALYYLEHIAVVEAYMRQAAATDDLAEKVALLCGAVNRSLTAFHALMLDVEVLHKTLGTLPPAEG